MIGVLLLTNYQKNATVRPSKRSVVVYHCYVCCSVYGRGGQLNKAADMFGTARSMALSLDEKAYMNLIGFFCRAGMDPGPCFSDHWYLNSSKNCLLLLSCTTTIDGIMNLENIMSL